MDRNELERELLELCERVAGARGRYAEQCKIEDTIRSISGYAIPASGPYREAKELLADMVRERALSEDHLWRQLVIGCADRIAASYETKLNDLHNAARIESESATRNVEAIELLRLMHERVKESAINYGDFEDLMSEVENFLGIAPEPENPDETKGDLDFHREREES